MYSNPYLNTYNNANLNNLNMEQLQQLLMNNIAAQMNPQQKAAQQQQQNQQEQNQAKAPTFICQPVANIAEVDGMKWFEERPFFGVDETGEYIFKKEWDSKVPSSNVLVYKKIKRDEMPQPEKPMDRKEMLELIPQVMMQSLPYLLQQMGVQINNVQSTTAIATASTNNDEHLQQPANKPKGTVGEKLSKTSGDK